MTTRKSAALAKMCHLADALGFAAFYDLLNRKKSTKTGEKRRFSVKSIIDNIDNIGDVHSVNFSIVSMPKAVKISGGSVKARRRLVVLALVLSDVLLAFSVWGVSILLQGIWGNGPLSEVTLASIVSNVVAWVGLRALVGLYPGYGLGQVEELRRQTYAVLATLAVTTVFAVASQIGDSLSRLLLAMSFLGLMLLAPLVRHFAKLGMMRAGLWGKPVVVVGSGETGAQVVRLIQEEWDLGFKPVAVFDHRQAPAGGLLEGVPYGGTLTDAIALGRKSKVDTIILAIPDTPREHLAKIVSLASLNFRHVTIIPDLGGVTNSAVTARTLGGTFGVEIRYELLNPWALRFKRILDFVATVIGGALILPLILTLSLLVWLESRGAVFYKAQRTGQDGKPFECLKFRTMVPDAEALLQQMLEEDAEIREEYLKYHKLRKDPRITRVGSFLRKTSLDELPQLWNVLRGEMSLVGPRPYLPRESGEIGPTQGEILRVPPGITGPWQVAGRNHTSFDERVQMDARYVHDWSVWLDLLLLCRTVKTVLFDGGAY